LDSFVYARSSRGLDNLSYYTKQEIASSLRSSRKDSFEKSIAFGVLRDLAMTSQTALNEIILPTGKYFVNDGNQ
jgi:hypothetical protein